MWQLRGGSWLGCSARGDLQGPERGKEPISMGSPVVWVPGLVTLGCCMGWEFCCALALPWGDAVIFLWLEKWKLVD